MNILFVSPHYGRQRWYFPSAFAVLSAYLKKHMPDIHSDYVDVYRHGIESVRSKYMPKQHEIIAITGLTSHYASIKSLIRFVREFTSAKTTIFVGGAIITSYSEFMIRNLGADYYVVGEGEEAFLECVQAIANHKSVEGVKNVGYCNHGKVVINESRSFIDDLDQLPWQDYEAFDFRTYIKHNEYSGAVFASRGCPFHCGFCYRLFGSAYRVRGIASVLEEMEFLIKEYQVYNFFFGDELFFLKKNRVEEFCQILLKKRMKTTWSCSLRVNLVDPSLLKLMHQAGCMLISYGVESGNQGMLKKMGKNTTVQQNRNALKMTVDAHIFPSVNLIIGYPGETKESIGDTENLLDQTHCPGGLHFVQALPGTPLYKEVRELGFIPDEEQYFDSLQNEILGLPIDFTGLGKEFIEKEQRRITQKCHRYYRKLYRRYRWQRFKYYMVHGNINYFRHLLSRIIERIIAKSKIKLRRKSSRKTF